MASEHQKSSNPGGQEHLPPHPIVSYPPQQFNGHYPPTAPYPSFYTYAPVPDANHDPNSPNGPPPPGPYLMPYPPPPPGMVYAFPAPPPGQAYPPYAPGMPPPPNAPRPKRKQVKMACTNCAGACKRCDEARPCERCVKYGIADTCIDGIRKERKKGIKRGPYKRKNRAQGGDQASGGFTPPANGEGEQAPAPAAYAVPPEGYYPYYYPPHGYMPPGHDGQPHPEGPTNGNPHAIHPQYYPVHPMYAPYPPYPPPGPVPYAPAPAPAPGGSAVVATNGKGDQNVAHGESNGEGSNVTAGRKKRSRAKTDEGGAKGRKTKNLSSDSQTDGDAARGKDHHSGSQTETGSVFNGMDRTMVAV